MKSVVWLLHMEKRTGVTPKDFFLWVAAIAALYASTVSLLALWFAYIDRLVGTVNPYMDPFSTGMRIAVASLIIIFPLYLFFTRILHNDIRRHAEKRELWIRRWLLMLTLFGAGVTMVVDLIVLLNMFLGGEELTTAFLLKVASVLVVVGGVFWYYLNEVRGMWEKEQGRSQMVAGVAMLVVVASVVAAFFIIGTPRELRLMRYDQEKVYALQNIQSQVTTYWQQKQTLPKTTDDLKDPLSGFIVPVDPQSAEDAKFAYEYRPTGPKTFEVCATFNQESSSVAVAEDMKPRVAYPIGYYGPETEYWVHKAGRECFARTIDPERYPPFAKPVMR